jgi:GrxC family glutaredoxin
MQIQIYTKDYCPYCDRAKEFFQARGVAYDEINIQRDPEQYAALKARTQHMTVPQIFVDGQFIGGYTDMIAKVKQGELTIG